ncbi:hypothetical protein NXC24_PC00444 (plasmid) [Rhizobium sp. NXC24]|nr:hypothetical protein NXC24_PC00444 [Rhizobium sp. NXC24]
MLEKFLWTCRNLQHDSAISYPVRYFSFCGILKTADGPVGSERTLCRLAAIIGYRQERDG